MEKQSIKNHLYYIKAEQNKKKNKKTKQKWINFECRHSLNVEEEEKVATTEQKNVLVFCCQTFSKRKQLSGNEMYFLCFLFSTHPPSRSPNNFEIKVQETKKRK